ncbi:TonB-dependent receptor [Rhodocytophaga rosea]|uniref:TonB-dependent receptor n=1 Tax=Rhodocytophaga rosea TaxID=2704465 RepID=A0A6C0GJ85_9BACT|nr:TonB-dependent receptor [Rhodocytophaga rosea]QHT68131.1 TonB-dependent receptor [Rhodocytophaga rosea]
MMNKNILVWVCLLLVTAFGPELLAQGVTTASLNGTITDANGETLPGATVIAVHTPSGTQYGTATLPTGKYNLPNVRIGGPYTVTVSFVGYQEQKREGINLSLGQNLSLDFQLQSSDVQLSEVIISGERNSVISSDRTGAATSISNEQISRLPTLNRSFDDFTRTDPRANGQSFGGRNGGYNNITIDGALFNNAFGLSSTVGGQANAQPISLDAVEQIQVSIAPYDVRQGSFTGAGINAVTRSGTNEFSGSAYYFLRNENFVGEKVRDQRQPVANFDLYNTGFRLGGPIIKNKLFFFINGEMERKNDPLQGNFVASKPGREGSNVSLASAADLDGLSNFLRESYGYNAGPYEGYKLEQNSDKATARLDWNISNSHKLNIKYNYLKSYRDVNPSTSGALANGGNPTNTHMPFLAAYYRINNNLNSVIGELNSNFGNKFANTFTAGYTGFRDFRESSGGVFPLVNIGNGEGQSFTTFGYEPFSANNILNTDVWQFSDNFTIYAGKHVLTVGTYNEFYKFKNGFAPNYYGAYQFASLADFYSSATQSPNPATGAIANPTQYQIQYSALPSGEFPFAVIKASQLGFYVQDEFSLLSNLKVTGGLRIDIPIINSEIEQNANAAALSFRDGVQLNTGELQKVSLLWSPRVGFNYDVFNDKKTQLRGGTGIFTGRVPYVWVSNQASNNGLLFGSEFLTNPSNRPFTNDVNAYRPVGAAANTSYNLAVTEPGFKFPQVWRTNLAFDQQLPWGLIGTIEGIYTKDINAVYHQNVALPYAPLNASGADNRPIYYSVNQTTGAYTPNNTLYPRIPNNQGGNTAQAPNITNAILMRNTNKGYSYSVTGQLQKTFSNGFYGSIAYTYSDSKSVNDGGSIAQSIWRDRVVSGDPNEAALAYSNFLQKHRVMASASYRKEYLGWAATSISVFYNGAPNNINFSTRYSYTYAGDMNGDGSGGGGNDLIYVPRDQSEIVLEDITSGGNVVFSAADQWAALDAYISQDKYLKDRRGQYAERNGAENPFLSTFDVKLIQDFFINVGGKRNTLQFSLDIFNFGNMLNSNWGVPEEPIRRALLNFRRIDTEGRPVFQYALNNGEPLTTTFRPQSTINARWQMQFGVRYIFN